jgi:hypothetical protein
MYAPTGEMVRGSRYFLFLFESLLLLTKRKDDVASNKKSLTLEAKAALSDVEEANVSATFLVAAADLKLASKKKGLTSHGLFFSCSCLAGIIYELLSLSLSLPLSLSLSKSLGGSTVSEPRRLKFGKAEEEKKKYHALFEKEREKDAESSSACLYSGASSEREREKEREREREFCVSFNNSDVQFCLFTLTMNGEKHSFRVETSIGEELARNISKLKESSAEVWSLNASLYDSLFFRSV